MKRISRKKRNVSRRNFLRQTAGLSLFLLPLNGFIPFFVNTGKNSTFSPFVNKETSRYMNNTTFEPGYLKLHRSGELKRRGDILWQKMEICDLCPRECEKKRLDRQKGDCGSTSELEVSSYNPHFGEEEPLVMDGGSGTIFFTHCSMRCVFCINYDISILGYGQKRSIQDLASMMLKLQEMGCENINVVTPSHYSPHIVKALDVAAGKGLMLPLVYNTSGYEKLETLRLLEGVVDIYLPDFKYFEGEMAAKYSKDAENYPAMSKAALLEMQRQVGTAKPDDTGKIYRGLMIRHLVMPNGVSGTQQVLEWIAHNLPKDTYVNLMSQYRPAYRAGRYPEIARGITNREYYDAIQHARRAGLTNVEIQG